jgi:hypothetical protein
MPGTVRRMRRAGHRSVAWLRALLAAVARQRGAQAALDVPLPESDSIAGVKRRFPDLPANLQRHLAGWLARKHHGLNRTE